MSQSPAEAIIREMTQHGCSQSTAEFVVQSIGPVNPSTPFDYNCFGLFAASVTKAIHRIEALGWQTAGHLGYEEWANAFICTEKVNWRENVAIPNDLPKGGGTGIAIWGDTPENPFYATITIDHSGVIGKALRELQAIYLALVVASSRDKFDPRTVARHGNVEALGVVIRRVRIASESESQLPYLIPLGMGTVLKFFQALSDAFDRGGLNQQDTEDIRTVLASARELLPSFPTVPSQRAGQQSPAYQKSAESNRPEHSVGSSAVKGRPSASTRANPVKRAWRKASKLVSNQFVEPFPQPGPADVSFSIIEERRSIQSEERGRGSQSALYVEVAVEDIESESGAIPFSLLAQRVRNARAALIRINQDLPSHWIYPSRGDIHVILRLLMSDTLVGGLRLSASERAAMFVTLQTGRMWNAVLIGDTPPDEGGATISLSRQRIIVRPLLPADRAFPADNVADMLEPIETFIELPLHPLLVQALRSADPETSSLVDVSTGNIRRWLSVVNELYGTRLSISTLRNALTGALLRSTTDLLDITLITSDSRLSDHAGNYYYCPKRSNIADVYTCAIDWLWQNYEPACQKIEPIQLSGRIGSALYPKAVTIQGWIAHLKAQLIEANRRARSKSKIICYHNAYTAYVSLLIHFGLGFRPVNEPIARWSDIDFVRRLVLVSDKDQLHKWSTRFVPLAEMVFDALKGYQSHVATIRRRLRDSDSEKIDTWLDNTPTLFYLDDELNQIPDSAGARNAYMGSYASLAENVPRHWFRTAVRDSGGSGELTDAAMGHWRIGQHPASPSSAMRHSEAAKDLSPAIQRALFEAGFTVVQGCG